MITKLKIYAALLIITSPMSHAFVSYSDNQPVTSEPYVASKITKLKLRPGEQGILVNPPCKDPVGIVDVDARARKIIQVKQNGHSVSLRTALMTILPKGWHADKTYDLDADFPVSWKGGEAFPLILAKIAEQHHLSIKINWKKKRVLVRNACNQPEPTPINFATTGTTQDLNTSLLPTKATAVVTTPLATSVPSKPSTYYMLRAGQQMSEALREWCDIAKNEKEGVKWTLIWEAAKDQPIEANSFYGDRIEDAIAKLQATIIGNNIPLRVYQWDNHVIKVTN